MRLNVIFSFLTVLRERCGRVAHRLSPLGRLWSLPLVYLGVVLMALFYAVGWSTHPWAFPSCVLLIIAGVVGWVWHERERGRKALQGEEKKK